MHSMVTIHLMLPRDNNKQPLVILCFNLGNYQNLINVKYFYKNFFYKGA